KHVKKSSLSREFPLAACPSSSSIGLGLEHKIDRSCFAACNGDFLALIAVRLVPGVDRVLARGQISKLEFSVAARNRVMRILQHGGLRRGSFVSSPGRNKDHYVF